MSFIDAARSPRRTGTSTGGGRLFADVRRACRHPAFLAKARKCKDPESRQESPLKPLLPKPLFHAKAQSAKIYAKSAMLPAGRSQGRPLSDCCAPEGAGAADGFAL